MDMHDPLDVLLYLAKDDVGTSRGHNALSFSACGDKLEPKDATEKTNRKFGLLRDLCLAAIENGQNLKRL